jgi:hypothetical protein
MATALDDGGARLTSSLNEARNDTGRIAFCGPIVLSAITGYSVSKVENEIRAFRDPEPERRPIVKGTYAEEVAAALAHFGYRMDLKESYMSRSGPRCGPGCRSRAMLGCTTSLPSTRARKATGC